MSSCPYCRLLLSYAWGRGEVCTNIMCTRPVYSITRTANTANTGVAR